LNLAYKGSLFGVAGDDATGVIVFGLRGNAWRSTDEGASWRKIDINAQISLTGAANLNNGAIALVNQAGMVFVSQDHGDNFHALAGAKPGATAAVIDTGCGALILAGPRGLRMQSLK
jgi:photosystem II stability/assembly factor-like uncharacterized protein